MFHSSGLSVRCDLRETMQVALAKEETRRPVILVTEDDILVRATIAEYLRDAGLAVIEAANAAEAVAVFHSGTPVDLLFTDWQMPGEMDGMMLARWVGEHHPAIPVLLTSGYGNLAAMTVARNSFFPKPYSMIRVLARISELIEPPETV